MAASSSKERDVRRIEPDEQARADGAIDPYDPAYIFRSIFGSKMKGHWQTWPFIDLDELRSINPDCVGWIHMDGSPIDYPVVKQRFDRSYALTHNFSGEESEHGQVVMDFRLGGRMGGRSTVLRAHHMKDWSMFMAIVSLEEPEYLAAHPTVELIHEGTRYTARWCSRLLYRSSDPWPERTRFADDADFEAWLARVMAAGGVPDGPRPTADARLIACRTCAFDQEPNDSFAAVAVIEGQTDATYGTPAAPL
jgi:SrtB family sortase